MNKFLVAIFLFFFCTSARASTYCEQAVACWLFNEGSGGVINDSSGNGNVGTFSTPAWSSSSLPATYLTNSATFSRSDSQYISFSTNNRLGLGSRDYSISFWVLTNNNTQDQVVFCKGAVVTAGYFIQLTHLYNIRTQFEWQNGLNTALYSVSPGVTNGVWTHFVFTRTGRIVKIYRNGIINQSNVLQENGQSVESPADSSSYTFYIGRYNMSGFSLNGAIAETAIFDFVLNPSDVKKIYDTGLNTTASSRSIVITKQ